MELDDDICLCFHVSLRKVKKFIRIEKPTRPSQISQCYGAGTGCGWCRPFLEKLLTESQSPGGDGEQSVESLPSVSAGQYAQQRKTHVRQAQTPSEDRPTE